MPAFSGTFFDDDYANLCDLLRDGDTVVDVGCYDGRYVNAVRDHLLEHGIRVRTIGIDACPTERLHDGPAGLAAAARAALDRFVLSRVEDIHDMDGVTDVVSCIRFPLTQAARREAYRRIAALLKPGGRALYYVHARTGHGRAAGPPVYGMSDNEAGITTTTRVLSKDEAAEHAEQCVTPPNDGRCNHGHLVDIVGYMPDAHARLAGIC